MELQVIQMVTLVVLIVVAVITIDFILLEVTEQQVRSFVMSINRNA